MNLIELSENKDDLGNAFYSMVSFPIPIPEILEAFILT